jgi:hypothetical protein
MNARRPPRLATWLLARCFDGEHREALMGDLAEQHHGGRSRLWYWRQTVAAIAVNVIGTVRAEPWIAGRALALSAYLMFALDTLFMTHPAIQTLVAVNGWYRSLISWLIVMEWDSARHVVYDLHLASSIDTLFFCGNLAGISWIACRLHPRHRPVIVATMVVSGVGLCLHYLGISVTNWIQAPGSPLWFFNLFWFALFAFVAIPASVVCGSRWAARGRGATTFAAR